MQRYTLRFVPIYVNWGPSSLRNENESDLLPRAAFLNALEQVLHAAAEFGGDVGFEMQFGDAKKPQTCGEFATQKILGVLQRS